MMCMVKDYKCYIANVHINEKIIFFDYCNTQLQHIKNIKIKLKILNDIHSDKIHTGLLLLFNLFLNTKIKYNYFNENGSVCYIIVIKSITNEIDSFLYYMLNSLSYIHRNNNYFVQENIKAG